MGGRVLADAINYAVACVGPGAIGGTLGAHLARAGHDVTLVDTVDAHVDAINRDGIRITGPVAEFTQRVPAFTASTLAGVGDTVILATKAHHTSAAVRALHPHLSDAGCVVSAQNGRSLCLLGSPFIRPIGDPAMVQRWAEGRPLVVLRMLKDGHQLTDSVDTIWTASADFLT